MFRTFVLCCVLCVLVCTCSYKIISVHKLLNVAKGNLSSVLEADVFDRMKESVEHGVSKITKAKASLETLCSL
jgi:hypothetical protein